MFVLKYRIIDGFSEAIVRKETEDILKIHPYSSNDLVSLVVHIKALHAAVPGNIIVLPSLHSHKNATHVLLGKGSLSL